MYLKACWTIAILFLKLMARTSFIPPCPPTLEAAPSFLSVFAVPDRISLGDLILTFRTRT